MELVEKLEKLNNLKERGLLTKAEFDVQKKAMIGDTTSQNPPKQQLIYVLLAFFVGNIGIHNFYARRKKSAIAQLLMTFPGCFLLVPMIIAWYWVVIEIFVVKKDGSGRLFKPSKGFAISMGVAKLVLTVVCVVTLLSGFSAGYTNAIKTQETIQIMNYVTRVSVQSHNAANTVAQPCSYFISPPIALENLKCNVRIGVVELRINDTNVANSVKSLFPQAQENGDYLIFPVLNK